MKPLELVVKHIDKHWQCTGGLRMWSNDDQICGHEYCAEGAIADVFIKYAPEEALKNKCKWDGNFFVWEENGESKREALFLPLPVMRWIDEGHGEGTAEKLRMSLAYLNDRSCRWSLEQIGDLIALQFGLGDPLAVAKSKGQKMYASVIKEATKEGYTHA